jgi:hypothetical protein
VPSDPGPEHVADDSRFGALQLTSDDVESVLQDLNVNKFKNSVGSEQNVGVVRQKLIAPPSLVSVRL